MRHEFVEKLVATFAGKVGAPAATLAAKVLGKDAYVSPTGRVDPVLKDPEASRTRGTRSSTSTRARSGPTWSTRCSTKLKVELGIK